MREQTVVFRRKQDIEIGSARRFPEPRSQLKEAEGCEPERV